MAQLCANSIPLDRAWRAVRLAGSGLACLAAAALAVGLAAPARAGCSDAARPNVEWVRCDHGQRDLSGVDLTGGDLRDSTFTRAEFTGAKLKNADARRASFVSTDMENASLAGAKLLDADFTRANLTGADLSGADLRGARLFRANLTNADLSNARLDDADLFRADLSGATWVDGETVCAQGSTGMCK